MGRICKTKAGLAGCGAADTQERERGRCKEEIKRKKSARVGGLKPAGRIAGVRNNTL